MEEAGQVISRSEITATADDNNTPSRQGFYALPMLNVTTKEYSCFSFLISSHNDDRYAATRQHFLSHQDQSASESQLSRRQDPSSNTLRLHEATPRLTALRSYSNINGVAKLVFNNHGPRAIRVQGSNRLNTDTTGIGVATSAREHRGTARHELAELAHHIVVSGEVVRAGCGIHDDKAGARTAGSRRVEAGTVIGIGSERPGEGAHGPVLHGAHGEVGGLVPSGIDVGGPALGMELLEVLDVGVVIVELGQDGPVEGVSIAVPCRSVDVLRCYVHDGLRVIRSVWPDISTSL
jgi:hypothetical protein